ncbi:carbohydrate-binding protein [Paenibacillaceae bacterium]|nr:carbohydrate-binding protein [Paenibacillaceae bacterium]
MNSWLRNNLLSKTLLIFIALCMVLVPVIPSDQTVQASGLGNIINASASADALSVTIDNGTSSSDILEIAILKEDLFRVNYRPAGAASSPSTPMIDPDASWEAVGAVIDDSGDPVVITTPKMEIQIARTPARMTVKKADGTTLLWEPSAGGVFHDGIRFQHNAGDNIYGIRNFSAQEDVGGLLRNNSDHPAHAGQQGDSGGPFMWSTAGYGVLVDSDGGYPYTDDASGKLEFYYGGTPIEGRRYSKSNVEYYVMLGEPRDIMTSYADVTGTSPMLPKWSLGFMHFEWGIDQEELEQYVDTYRAKNIPLDAYALDYDWMRYGEDNYGEFKWNTDNYPDAATTALKDKMDGKGIKMIGIRKPRVITKDFGNQRTQQYYDADNGGFFYPGHNEYTDYFIPVTVRSFDPYTQAARDWWWNNSIDAFDKGIVGWWNDETDKVDSYPASYWFGNYTTGHFSQAMYEGQRDYTNDNTRVWQTARSFYPGTQRYGTTLWSGDIGIQFYKGELFPWAPGMQEQPRIMLSSANLGQPKWGMDTGGFNSASGMGGGNPSPELYARWMQFGAFVPVDRVHGNYNQQRQPWFYGSTAEEISKAALHLRYSLIPYMYAYEREAYETGLGLIKPLLFDYPNDPQAADYTDGWMFGDWLLVSPVLGKDQTSHQVYLPEGTWIDYFRGDIYNGGQTIHYPVNAETWTDIPLFVKQGAIIPTQKVQDYIGQHPVTTVNVDVFPDSNETSFTYYDDNGSSYAYEQDSYFKQKLVAQHEGASGIRFEVAPKSGDYVPELAYYVVQIHGNAGAAATLNGSPLTAAADLQALNNLPGEGWTTGKDVYGDVTYVKLAAGSTTSKVVEITGTAVVSATHAKYEAEEASLFGETLAGQAGANTNHSGYSGDGFADGLDQDGAGVTFYANVTKGGDYAVDLRYANGSSSNQTMSIYVNSVRIKQAVLDSTGAWNQWDTLTEKLPLTAGQNIITLKYEADAGDTGGVNLDYIEVPFEPVQATYPAESAKLRGGAAAAQNHWFYTGTAFVDGLSTVGASAEFDVHVPAAGNYNLSLRYANGSGSTQTISTYVNNARLGQISLSSPLMNWNVWEDYEDTVALSAGRNTIRYQYDAGDSGGINLDRLLVSANPIVQAENERNLLDNGDFERNTLYNSNWTQWYPAGQSSVFGTDSGSGINPPESPFKRNQRAFFYSPTAYQQSIHQAVDVPENNATYRLEARVRLQNTTPHVARAEVVDYGGSPLYYNINNDGQWRYISIDNIYVTSGKIDVGFYVDSPGYTTLHIDEVSVTKVE